MLIIWPIVQHFQTFLKSLVVKVIPTFFIHFLNSHFVNLLVVRNLILFLYFLYIWLGKGRETKHASVCCSKLAKTPTTHTCGRHVVFGPPYEATSPRASSRRCHRFTGLLLDLVKFLHASLSLHISIKLPLVRLVTQEIQRIRVILTLVRVDRGSGYQREN